MLSEPTGSEPSAKKNYSTKVWPHNTLAKGSYVAYGRGHRYDGNSGRQSMMVDGSNDIRVG